MAVADMSKARVEVTDYGVLDHREWLRREVLWGSLMTPYDEQFNNWINVESAAYAQHAGNASRKDTYTNEQEFSEAYFQHGKTAAGLLTSVCMFRLLAKSNVRTQDLLRLQTIVIDDAITADVKHDYDEQDKITIYERCTTLAKASVDGKDRLAKQKLRHAGRLIMGIAAAETQAWISDGMQNADNTLPRLVIPNGGHPRSAGNRVDFRQTLFSAIVGSDNYHALAA